MLVIGSIRREAAVRQPAAEDREATLAQPGDGGRRGGGELLLGGSGHAARLQPDEAASAHQVGDARLSAGQRQLALKVGRVGGDPVEGRDAAESAQARVDGRAGDHVGYMLTHRKVSVKAIESRARVTLRWGSFNFDVICWLTIYSACRVGRIRSRVPSGLR